MPITGWEPKKKNQREASSQFLSPVVVAVLKPVVTQPKSPAFAARKGCSFAFRRDAWDGGSDPSSIDLARRTGGTGGSS